MTAGAFAAAASASPEGIIGENSTTLNGLYYRSPPRLPAVLSHLHVSPLLPPTSGFMGNISFSVL